MAVKREIARVTDDAVWDAFVELSPQGGVFSTSAWMRAAAEAQGGEPVMLGVFENGRLSGGCAFLEIKRGPFRKATAPVLAPYCGFLFAPFSGTRPSEGEHQHAVDAGALIASLLSGYQQVFLLHGPGVDDVREFLWRGFSCQVRYTYTLDIADAERLCDGLERKARRVVKKAEAGLFVENSRDTMVLGSRYEQLYRDRGIRPPIPRTLIETLARRALDEGIGEIRVARDSAGEVVSALFLVFDHRTVYALASGAIPSRNDEGGASLLFWDAMNRHAGTRATFDFVGANMRSIAFFKKGFGGRLTPYFVTEWYSSPLTRAMFTAYAGIRKVFR